MQTIPQLPVKTCTAGTACDEGNIYSLGGGTLVDSLSLLRIPRQITETRCNVETATTDDAREIILDDAREATDDAREATEDARETPVVKTAEQKPYASLVTSEVLVDESYYWSQGEMGTMTCKVGTGMLTDLTPADTTLQRNSAVGTFEDYFDAEEHIENEIINVHDTPSNARRSIRSRRSDVGVGPEREPVVTTRVYIDPASSKQRVDGGNYVNYSDNYQTYPTGNRAMNAPSRVNGSNYVNSSANNQAHPAGIRDNHYANSHYRDELEVSPLIDHYIQQSKEIPPNSNKNIIKFSEVLKDYIKTDGACVDDSIPEIALIEADQIWNSTQRIGEEIIFRDVKPLRHHHHHHPPRRHFKSASTIDDIMTIGEDSVNSLEMTSGGVVVSMKETENLRATNQTAENRSKNVTERESDPETLHDRSEIHDSHQKIEGNKATGSNSHQTIEGDKATDNNSHQTIEETEKERKEYNSHQTIEETDNKVMDVASAVNAEDELSGGDSSLIEDENTSKTTDTVDLFSSMSEHMNSPTSMTLSEYKRSRKSYRRSTWDRMQENAEIRKNVSEFVREKISAPNI